jgi:sugar phosphate isomerase/epimerase
MITSYPDFTHPEASQRIKELELEVRVVEVARKLGAKMLRVTAGQAHPQTGRNEGVDWAVEGLSRLTESVKDSGVQLVYENHAKPGAWQYTDFSQPPQIFLEIVRQTADCDLGINFDTANAATFAEDPIALLESVVERVISIHASDSSTRGALNHTLLGKGITPYQNLFACLKRHGWNGWICMEEASNLGRAGVEQAASFVRKTWEIS